MKNNLNLRIYKESLCFIDSLYFNKIKLFLHLLIYTKYKIQNNKYYSFYKNINTLPILMEIYLYVSKSYTISKNIFIIYYKISNSMIICFYYSHNFSNII